MAVLKQYNDVRDLIDRLENAKARTHDLKTTEQSTLDEIWHLFFSLYDYLNIKNHFNLGWIYEFSDYKIRLCDRTFHKDATGDKHDFGFTFLLSPDSDKPKNRIYLTNDTLRNEYFLIGKEQKRLFFLDNYMEMYTELLERITEDQEKKADKAEAYAEVMGL